MLNMWTSLCSLIPLQPWQDELEDEDRLQAENPGTKESPACVRESAQLDSRPAIWPRVPGGASCSTRVGSNCRGQVGTAPQEALTGLIAFQSLTQHLQSEPLFLFIDKKTDQVAAAWQCVHSRSGFTCL